MMKRVLFLAVLTISTAFAFSKDYKKITLEKIWLEGTFSQKSVYGLKSMNDGEHYSVLEMDEGVQKINKYDYEKGKLAGTILSNQFKDDAGNPIRIESYSFSEDEKSILFRSRSERIYRHSMRSEYYVVDLSTNAITRVGEGKFQLASFSPDGKWISYVKENNLYLFNLANKTEKQITQDGEANKIIYGAPDWVYEEEFVLVKAYEWSGDSKHLAFYRFDESNVKEFSFPMYGSLYPENYVYKYPKVGEDNSVVGIQIHHLENGKNVPVNFDIAYEYIPRISWMDRESKLCVQLMNRKQNNLNVVLADPESGKITPFFGEQSDTYLEVQDIHFLKDQDAFLWMSEKDNGFNALYLAKYEKMQSPEGMLYLVQMNEPISQKGDIVTDLIGMDEPNNTLYYLTTNKFNPGDRLAIRFRLNEPHGRPTELVQGYGRVVHSKNFKYFISYNSNISSPLEVKVHGSDGFPIRTIEDNKILKDTLKKYELGKKELFKFLNRDSLELFGWMIKPPNFDPNKKYPVLMYVYGGPGSQTVTNSWGGSNDMWYKYLAQQGYIVASIDNRGTGARGKEFRDCTYGQLGNLETQDQIDGARYLRLLNYVDENRIGIWGWSYGGYMSTLCLAKGADLFKMAIAVAPVTNWKYYDSIYTERYMGLLKDNAESYDENSPINHVGKIKGKYLLVHGTADDNVHFQNTAELISELTRKDVQFDLAIYPNKNHGIYGGNTRYHLFTKMSDFIFENL